MPLHSRGTFPLKVNPMKTWLPGVRLGFWGSDLVLRTGSVPGCLLATLAPAELCISPAGTVPRGHCGWAVPQG